MLLGQRVQEHGIDVVADAEGKQSHTVGRASLCVVQDLPDVGHALGGLAIRQKDDHGGPLVACLRHGLKQRPVDIRATQGLQLLHPSGGRVGLGGRAQPRRVLPQPTGEGDDAETVLLVQVLQNILERLPRLLDLLSVH